MCGDSGMFVGWAREGPVSEYSYESVEGQEKSIPAKGVDRCSYLPYLIFQEERMMS